MYGKGRQMRGSQQRALRLNSWIAVRGFGSMPRSQQHVCRRNVYCEGLHSSHADTVSEQAWERMWSVNSWRPSLYFAERSPAALPPSVPRAPRSAAAPGLRHASPLRSSQSRLPSPARPPRPPLPCTQMALGEWSGGRRRLNPTAGLCPEAHVGFRQAGNDAQSAVNATAAWAVDCEGPGAELVSDEGSKRTRRTRAPPLRSSGPPTALPRPRRRGRAIRPLQPPPPPRARPGRPPSSRSSRARC